ncbi:hypothetical protein C6495_15115 [Candidatus Poribacteria bacterium]|nr:MAG: hypothetical protein C6495_15115 [Candidatus Poribacteria bacterium]
MKTAHDTVTAYFDALVARDAENLIELMHPVSHYVKIGTDAGEILTGGSEIAAYYENHVASTEDFSITFLNLDVQVRNEAAWFYTRQIWRLRWQGNPIEEFVMRMTGVLERVDGAWKFVQIHASTGVLTT